MTKIMIMKQADIDVIKANAGAYLSHFSEKDSRWLEESLGHSPFEKTRYDFPELDLYMPDDVEHRELTDKQNVHEVYSKLKFLSPSQASDERLWAGLCMGPFWKYTAYRWNIDSGATVCQHYFFGYSARRSLTRNAACRLWRTGQLTYDPERQDSFELTDFVCENSRFIVDVLERNVSDSVPLMRDFLGACLDLKKAGYELDTTAIRELQKYTDILGGVCVLDYMPAGYLYGKIIEKGKSIMAQSTPESTMEEETLQEM